MNDNNNDNNIINEQDSKEISDLLISSFSLLSKLPFIILIGVIAIVILLKGTSDSIIIGGLLLIIEIIIVISDYKNIKYIIDLAKKIKKKPRFSITLENVGDALYIIVFFIIILMVYRLWATHFDEPNIDKYIIAIGVVIIIRTILIVISRILVGYNKNNKIIDIKINKDNH